MAEHLETFHQLLGEPIQFLTTLRIDLILDDLKTGQVGGQSLARNQGGVAIPG